MDRDQGIKLMQDLLRRMVERKGSDLFITAGFPPAIKIDGEIKPQTNQPLTPEQAQLLVRAIMNDRQTKEFDATRECNFAIAPPGIGRFRVSAFVQMGLTGAVLRTINAKIPTIEELDLPPILKEIVLSKRGLVILVGATGSGKSTSLAAMVDYRNDKTRGHIITIEDPIEYVHAHRNCVVTQREVGVDTESWHMALKNTLRQAPDVIQIGEIRDRETMEYGIQFAETGHLVLATLHANSANQALDRIINFFPEDRREQLLMDLSLNIRAMISQRLVPREAGKGRIAAMEILLNTPLIADLIFRGEVAAIKEIMAKSNRLGMKTFDQALYELFETGVISYEEALRNADSKNEIRLRIKLESKRKDAHAKDDTGSLRILEEEE
jgi:pilus retraction protein PilT